MKSITKTDRHDITEILFKGALNTTTLPPPSFIFTYILLFLFKDFTALEHHGGCLIRNRNCLPFVSPWFTIAVLVGSVLLIVLFFFAVFFVAVFVLWFFRS
jgi:hypothetical protein